MKGDLDPNIAIETLKNKFIQGKSVELIDGNNNSINSAILKDIFDGMMKELNTSGLCENN